MSNKFIPLILCIILSISIQAQNDKLLSVKKMKKDFDEMLLILEAHPDPFTHISEDAFMKKFKAQKDSFTKPLPVLDYYKSVASMIALIKDGHSSVTMPKGWYTKQRKTHGAFPLSFHLSDEDELFVLKNYGGDNIPIGAQITKINDLSVAEFLNVIDHYISYELKHFRNTIIDDDLEFYLYLVFGQSHNTKLEYTTGKEGEITIQNIPLKEWQSKNKDTREERGDAIAKGEPYSYEKINDGVGILKIYSFWARDLDNYEHFLFRTFKSIQRDSIHSLILDVRGNYGGWPKISSLLFHYLTDVPFKTLAQDSLKISRAYREYFTDPIPELRNTDYVFRTNLHQIDINTVLRGEIGSFKSRSLEYNEISKKRKFDFEGNLYLLTNRDSYSAASSFASTFQCYRMGTIVGAETGGTKIFRANAMQKKLSSSLIIISLSTTKIFTACYNQEFQGVTPDLEYTPSINELVSGMDTQLMFTQRLIKQIQKKKAEMKSGQ